MDKKTELCHSGIALAIKRSRAAHLFIAALAVLWIGAIFAAEDVYGDIGSFLYINEEGLTVTEKIEYSLITEETQNLSEGWNVVQKEVTCANLNCGKDSKILLTDGSKLTTMIKVAEGQTLSVYGSSTYVETMGQIICNTQSKKSAGIGGWDCDAGTIVINGGWIIAGEDCSGPCIGGCDSKKSGDITINGGLIEAVNNIASYACIGGASNGGGGKVTINQGTIITSGPGVGIGAGNNSQPVKVTINGGVIKANNTAKTEEDVGVGIGAGKNSVPCVKINGGQIKTDEKKEANLCIGIGGVTACSKNDEPEIEILGGTVNAKNRIGFAGGHGTDTGNYDIVLGHSDARDKIGFVYIVGNVKLHAGKQFLYLDGDYTGEQFKPEDILSSTSSITLVPMKYELQYNSGGQQVAPTQGANPEYFIKLHEGTGLSGPDGGPLYRWKINGKLYKGGQETKIIKGDQTVEPVWTIPVTVNGIKAKTRTYDGTTRAEPEVNGDVLKGIDEADKGKVEITAQPEAISFDSANAGKNIGATIDFTKLELTGEMAEKYFLKEEGSLLNTSGDIDPKHVTVTGVSAKNRDYDGTCDVELDLTNAVIGGIIDGAELGIKSKDDKSGTIQSKDAGTNKPVTMPDDLELTGTGAGNYTVSAADVETCYVDILPKPVTIKADHKTCWDLLHKTPLSWQIEDAQNNWYEAADPDIAFLITDSSGRTAKIDQLKFGERYTIEPAWAAGKENKNYSADFVAGEFDTAHTWDAGKVTKEATEKADGVKTYTCTVCKATRTETIPKTEIITEPSVPEDKRAVPAQISAKGSDALIIGWKDVEGAEGYDVFFAKCNHKNKKWNCKVVKTIEGGKNLNWTQTGLKKGTSYKFYVRAYVMENGVKTYIGKTPMMHAYAGGSSKKYTNAKSVKVNKTKVTLTKGKTFKIKAKVNKVNKKKKLMPKSHVPTLRYMTSDSSVATVSKSGKITAKGKGTCYIYAYAHNGVSKRVKVTVK